MRPRPTAGAPHASLRRGTEVLRRFFVGMRGGWIWCAAAACVRLRPGAAVAQDFIPALCIVCYVTRRGSIRFLPAGDVPHDVPQDDQTERDAQ
jgi:hypothetical protein